MYKTFLLVVGCLFWLTAPTAIGNKKSLTIDSSGWVKQSSEVDLNGDLDTGGESTSHGKSTMGPVSSGGMSDLIPWDGVTFCDFDPDSGLPIAVELVYAGTASITRFQNGDLLYTVMNPSPPSTLCFNFIDSTSTFTIYTDVTGGTGGFEGATGTAVSTGSAENVVPDHLDAFGITTKVQLNTP